ncbi:heavy-metal-associated domain-containing protein [Flavobacterium sp. DGU11]|uniref:Heavy-metal-associated domain-containing protein n=1 Tax=Flavobacterium arundinis TaxID=3139143 RepID=A0ABU9HVM6_9FLAO
MEQLFVVENIKCGGCENTIKKALKKIPQVEDVVITLETGTIKITGTAHRDVIVNKLHVLGYPQKGENSFVSKAKSYLSCAIGKATAS